MSLPSFYIHYSRILLSLELENIIPNTWNALPTNIVNAPSLDAFKNRLDDHWKNYQFIEDMRTVPLHRTVSNAAINFW